jgi:ubiquitin C-terminal hydrolase
VSNFSQKKLNYFINIPSDIRLDFLLKDKDKYRENTLYNLFAIVVHVGTGNDYGHYYCVIKIAGKWVKFDDENVLIMEKTDISSLFGNPDEEYEFTVNNCAYLLFYEISENNI